jgi:hypothetical protein
MAASDGDRIVQLLLRPYLLAPRIAVVVDEDILVEEVDDDDEGVVKESEWTDIMATC